MEQGWGLERWAMFRFLRALNVLFLLGIKVFLSQDAWVEEDCAPKSLIFETVEANMCIPMTLWFRGEFRSILTLTLSLLSMWQIRSLDMLRTRFTYLPAAFTKRLRAHKQAHQHNDELIYYTWKYVNSCVKLVCCVMTNLELVGVSLNVSNLTFFIL